MMCSTPEWEFEFANSNSEFVELQIFQIDESSTYFPDPIDRGGAYFPRILGAPKFEFYEGWDRILNNTVFYADGRYVSSISLADPSYDEVMVIEGYGFDVSATNYECMFSKGDDSMSTGGVALSRTQLKCPIPIWGAQFTAADNVQLSIRHMGNVAARVREDSRSDVPRSSG